MSVPFQCRLLSVDLGAPMIMDEFIALIRGTQPRTRTTQVQLIQRADMAEPDLLGIQTPTNSSVGAIDQRIRSRCLEAV